MPQQLLVAQKWVDLTPSQYEALILWLSRAADKEPGIVAFNDKTGRACEMGIVKKTPIIIRQ